MLVSNLGTVREDPPRADQTEEEGRKETYMDEQKILRQTIEAHGESTQLLKLMEEMAELQKEVCKYQLGAENLTHIAEEAADVLIMLEQLELMLGIGHMIAAQREWKLQRLQKTLNETFIKI